MSAAEIIPFLLYAALALGGSIFLVVGFAGSLQAEPYIRKWASAWLPTFLLFGFASSTMVSGRNVSLYGLANNLMEESGTGGSGVWMLRIATALAVGASTLVVAAAYLRKGGPQTAARPLFMAFSLYFFFSYVVSGIFGTEIAITHKTFYPYLVIFALYITTEHDETLLLRIVRDALLLFLVAGLCLIPLKPDLVLQKGYVGFIPGFSYRYWGLASHANNIAPLAIFFFLVICWLPYKTRLAMLFAIVVAVITLTIAQSKTSIVAALIIAGVFTVRLWLLAIFSNKFGRAGYAFAVGIIMLAAGVVLIALVADLYSAPLDHLLHKIQGRGTLLTGREFIWSITIAEWEKSPLFGYGPALWGTEFSARFGYFGIASNAHNQFFDTLGAAGVLGATSLVIYLIVLVRYALMLAGPSKWISVALVAFVVTRCISEVPLKTMNITTSDFFMHAVLLGLFMRAAARQEKTSLLPNQTITIKNTRQP